MKVWIVCYDYIEEGFDIVGVFTSKERAEEVGTKVGLWGPRKEYENTFIKEIELDVILGDPGEFNIGKTED